MSSDFNYNCGLVVEEIVVPGNIAKREKNSYSDSGVDHSYNNFYSIFVQKGEAILI